jgi:NAD+ diphosphatase
LSEKAFFFQGDTLLLPADFPDSHIGRGVPLELANNFNNPEPPPNPKNEGSLLDIFEIPAIDTLPLTVIRGVSVLPETVLPENWRGISVRQVLSILSGKAAENAENLDKIIRACHIAQWRRESLFCGRCGAKNIDIVEDNSTQRRCPECGKTEFPRICPAIIIAITDDENRILLAHNKKFKVGVYSHISGFNEAGETLEAAVVREIREEVNIEVKDIVYVKSQPWPFPNSLMIGFKAHYSSGTIQPDGVEIEDAGWFDKDNLPNLPTEGSLSRFLINSWLNGTLH